MATSKPQLKTYINEEDYIKFKALSQLEGRSTSNMLAYIVHQKIVDYETKNGTINIKNNITIGDNNKGDININ